MRVAITYFCNHADLTNDTIDWKKKPVADRTWINFKIHFGKVIQRNKKDQGTFSKLGIANTAIEYNVSALAAAAVLQSKIISALQAELTVIKAYRFALQEMANSITTTPHDGMINMMVEAFKLAQPNSVNRNGSKSKRPEWTK